MACFKIYALTKNGPLSNCEKIFAVLLERECRDVFINNYNPQLLKNNPSNHDIQIIAGEEGAFDVAS